MKLTEAFIQGYKLAASYFEHPIASASVLPSFVSHSVELATRIIELNALDRGEKEPDISNTENRYKLADEHI